ncbi:VOC family protein [Hoeflea alexandrii]|uniref:VOC family protein n=1 Tax=Hoeflea alexandrii TaxID=288436 RepID=A0ABT1CUW8_9HYPH|nr:VOC family protein [Hoeflea alexandrii]MCO6409997.1 VOC family protein [Hoeflea alexandrii]
MPSSFDMTRRAALNFLAAAPVLANASTASAAPVAPSFAVTTPIHIHSVSLRVRDLEKMTYFYNAIIGLDVLGAEPDRTALGKDGRTLVTLIRHVDDDVDDVSTAGLYHTAFLMPTREDLGRWLIMAYMNGIPFTGFSDHRVSEALYLNDPEGNGIEVYADRPHQGWQWVDNRVVMGNQQLDLDNLVAGLPDDSDLPYSAPSGFRIGHIHMRVGDTRLAQDFYVKATGLDLTALIPNESAAFFSNGRYHHHVGANIWHSRNAGQRPQNMSGLEDAAFSIEPALMDGLRRRLRAHGTDIKETGSTLEALDPWGTRIRFISG